MLLLPSPPPLRKDVKNYFSFTGLLAVPRAVGQTLGNTSPLLAPILKAPKTAYSYNTKDEAEVLEDPFATGTQLSLVSSLQARNSARVTVIGSAGILEDAWFDASVRKAGSGGQEGTTANREFAAKVSGWTFQELGVLKVGRVRHHLNEGVAGAALNESALGYTVDVNPKMYRIKNDVVSTLPTPPAIPTH